MVLARVFKPKLLVILGQKGLRLWWDGGPRLEFSGLEMKAESTDNRKQACLGPLPCATGERAHCRLDESVVPECCNLGQINHR